MATPGTISGKKSGGTLGGANISGVHSFSWEEEPDKLDATVGASLGKTRTDTGCVGVKVTFDCYFLIGEAVIGTFRAGQWVENLSLYNELDGPLPDVDMPLGKIVSGRFKAEVRGRLEYTFVVESYDDYTING